MVLKGFGVLGSDKTQWLGFDGSGGRQLATGITETSLASAVQDDDVQEDFIS